MGLAYLVNRAQHAVGCDVSEALLAEAREHLPGVELVRVEAGELPFGDGSFDVVAMLEMLYYAEDQDSLVADGVRLLRPGGSVVVCLPNRDRPAFNPSPLSTSYPNAPELADLLHRNGLEATIYGAFVVEPGGGRDRVIDVIRHVAVRLHLIPRSMRWKALVKRIVYGRLPRLGAIHDGMAEMPAAVKLNPAVSTSAYKNLYAVGRKP
jgi:SAM-dependent methyltransferase